VDFFSGEVLCVGTGHSDLITSIKFAPDGRSVLSVGGDGCILVWELPPFVICNMQERLLEVNNEVRCREKFAMEQLASSSNSSDDICNTKRTEVASMSSLVSPIKSNHVSQLSTVMPSKVQAASTSTASAVPSEVNFAVVGSSLASKRVRSPTKKSRTTTATTATTTPDQST